jgi:NADH:ubiquinone oxidoreductase subunit 6 (subunit J)
MLSKFPNLLIAILLFAVLFVAIDDSNRVWAGKDDTNYIGVVNIAGGPGIGSGIFSDFIFSFELLSLLLIAALIGALYLAKKEA